MSDSAFIGDSRELNKKTSRKPIFTRHQLFKLLVYGILVISSMMGKEYNYMVLALNGHFVPRSQVG